MRRGYRLVAVIMKVMATTEMRMPTTMLAVRASPNTMAPTKIAVMGSNTPSTEAFVAPMFRVAKASVAVDTTVGSNASPTRLLHAATPSMPSVMPVW